MQFNSIPDNSKCRLHFRYVLVLIAIYNVWDLIGRYIPLLKRIKLESRKGLLIVILLRFLLVPAFYFAAKYADQGWMLLLTSFLGLTNGYLTVCILTCAPKGYKVSRFCNTITNEFITSLDILSNWFVLWKLLPFLFCNVQGPEQNALGNILVLFLIGGIFAGGVLDWLWLIGKGW